MSFGFVQPQGIMSGPGGAALGQLALQDAQRGQNLIGNLTNLASVMGQNKLRFGQLKALEAAAKQQERVTSAQDQLGSQFQPGSPEQQAFLGRIGGISETDPVKIAQENKRRAGAYKVQRKIHDYLKDPGKSYSDIFSDPEVAEYGPDITQMSPVDFGKLQISMMQLQDEGLMREYFGLMGGIDQAVSDQLRKVGGISALAQNPVAQQSFIVNQAIPNAVQIYAEKSGIKDPEVIRRLTGAAQRTWDGRGGVKNIISMFSSAGQAEQNVEATGLERQKLDLNETDLRIKLKNLGIEERRVDALIRQGDEQNLINLMRILNASSDDSGDGGSYTTESEQIGDQIFRKSKSNIPLKTMRALKQRFRSEFKVDPESVTEEDAANNPGLLKGLRMYYDYLGQPSPF